MPISRLATNLKNQHWSTLGLELIIVIIGIFLGLQADSWYQDRLEKQELDTYLQGVANELNSSASIRSDYIRFHQRMIDGMKLALKALDGQSLSAEQERSAYGGLANLNTPPTNPQRTALTSAMQMSGMFRIIENPTLQQALGDILSSIYGEDAEYNRYMNLLTTPDFNPTIVQYGFDEEGDVTVTNVDWVAAGKDPMFRLRVLQGIRLYTAQLHHHQARLLINQQVLELLAQQGINPTLNWLEEFQKLRTEN